MKNRRGERYEEKKKLSLMTIVYNSATVTMGKMYDILTTELEMSPVFISEIWWP